jgi:hypothetical protein
MPGGSISATQGDFNLNTRLIFIVLGPAKFRYKIRPGIGNFGFFQG